jgi:hypothetical protein
MNFRAIALAAILGVSSPAVLDMAVSNQAVAAARYDYPEGSFSDGTWKVTLSFNNNVYYYYGENLRSGASISLAGAKASGNKARQSYTWNNNGLKYQVTWRPSEPKIARIQVIKPNGRVVLNSILEATRD